MTDKSCWECGFVSLGGNTLVGRCRWFVEVKGEKEPKDIPTDRCDKGCKFYKEKSVI